MRDIATLACALSLLIAPGSDPRSWVGRTVVKRDKVPLTLDGKDVDDPAAFRAYRVVEDLGDRLLVASGPVKGYIGAGDVVPIEEAVGHFTREIARDPGSPGAYLNRGLVHKERGRLDLAVADFDEAIRLDPKGVAGYNNRGTARHRKGDFDGAIADFDVAARLGPASAAVLANRGHARNDRRDHDLALADFHAALRLDPTAAQAHDGRGRAYSRKGDCDRAIADFNHAIRLDPKYEWAYNNRAWTWATCPDPAHRDGRRAVESAARACELTGHRDPTCLGTLAAAHAEAGDFARAVEFQTRSVRLTQAPDIRMKGEERLKLYREKTPYRDFSSK